MLINQFLEKKKNKGSQTNPTIRGNLDEQRR